MNAARCKQHMGKPIFRPYQASLVAALALKIIPGKTDVSCLEKFLTSVIDISRTMPHTTLVPEPVPHSVRGTDGPRT